MISFIVPAYNAGTFIEKCLLSITNQTYYDYEIIVINDGSVDNTRDILERFIIEHKNIDIILFNRENQGQGNARNFGVTKAKYDYIWFIDADDILYENNVVASAVVDLINEEPDIYIFSVYETDYAKRNIYWNYTKTNKATTIKKTPTLLFKQNWVWNKPIKRSFLIATGIEFNSRLMFEDIYFFCDLYRQAKKIYITRDVKYVYVKHEEALTASLKNFFSYPKALLYEFYSFIMVLFSKVS